MVDTIVKNLNIIEINVNSIIKLRPRLDLSNFITQYNPDLVLLNGTKLNFKHSITFKVYDIIRKEGVELQL